MALRIRLRRMGRRNAPTYRIVVAESAMPRDGRIVESLGHYNPRTDPLTLSVDRARALYWMELGATPTDTVHALLKRAGVFRPEEAGVSAAVATVTDAAKGAARRAGQAVKGVAGRAVGAVKDVAEDVREAVSEAAGEVREAAEDVIEKITGRDEDENAAGATTGEVAAEAGEPAAATGEAGTETGEVVAAAGETSGEGEPDEAPKA